MGSPGLGIVYVWEYCLYVCLSTLYVLFFVLVVCVCRCWELLYATCELMSHIHPALEDQLQQQMRRDRASSGATLPQDGFTRYVMQR